MRSDAIVGYTFQADILCPSCTVKKLFDEDTSELGSPEMLLNFAAERVGIDRTDERSFDSDDFPKVIFAVQVEEDERCGDCGEALIS